MLRKVQNNEKHTSESVKMFLKNSIGRILRHKTFHTKSPKIWHFWGNYALNYSAKANKPSQNICKKLQGQSLSHTKNYK